MDKFFNSEGPLMVFLGKMADLIWLNILTAICCIPIITAGASITAMYAITIKMVNKEEGYITKGFFKAFKDNFKQATIIWLIILAFAALFYGDYRIIFYAGMEFPKAIIIVLIAILVIAYSAYLYIFPLLARYENTTKNIFKNSFLLSVSNFPKTLLIVLIQAVPWIGVYFSQAMIPIIFLIGNSLVAYLSSMVFVTIFKKLEKKEEENNESNHAAGSL